MFGNVVITRPSRYHDHHVNFKAIFLFPHIPRLFHNTYELGTFPLITSKHKKSSESVHIRYFDLGKRGCMRESEAEGERIQVPSLTTICSSKAILISSSSSIILWHLQLLRTYYIHYLKILEVYRKLLSSLY